MLFLSSSLPILRVVLVSVSSADITDCCNALEREVVREAGEKPVKPLTSVVWAATERRIMKEEKTLLINIMKEYEQVVVRYGRLWIRGSILLSTPHAGDVAAGEVFQSAKIRDSPLNGKAQEVLD